jgi:hypothetical protein
MLTQTHFTDFKIRAFKGQWKSLRGITKHYECLTMVHEVCEEVRRYMTTTFTMKQRNVKKDKRGKQIYSFFKP